VVVPEVDQPAGGDLLQETGAREVLTRLERDTQGGVK